MLWTNALEEGCHPEGMEHKNQEKQVGILFSILIPNKNDPLADVARIPKKKRTAFSFLHNIRHIQIACNSSIMEERC